MGHNKLVRDIGVLLANTVTTTHRLEVTGIEELDFNYGGLIAFKHRSNMDIFLLTRIIPQFLHFPAKIGVVRTVPVLGNLIELAGAYPIIRPKDKGYRRMHPVNIGTYRSFFNIIKDCGWFAYAPEGTRVGSGMGEHIYPRFLIKASEYGLNVYLAGIKYSREENPWAPFTRVSINFERYHVNEKAFIDEVAEDIGNRLAVLSGIEEKVHISAARNHG